MTVKRHRYIITFDIKWQMKWQPKTKEDPHVHLLSLSPYCSVSLSLSLCARTGARSRRGLRKIIAIDFRRRNVEMLADGTFSSERLRTRRVALAKGRGRGVRCGRRGSKQPPSGSHPGCERSEEPTWSIEAPRRLWLD